MNIEQAISPKWRAAIWGVAVTAWLAQALAARDLLTADAVSYLDIADSCSRGNWHALVNGWWSPGYPFLLTFWLKLFKPDAFHEAIVVHLFAFVTLIVALAAFDHFMRVFFAFRAKIAGESGEDDGQSLPDGAILLAGYSLFFWIATFWIPPSLEQPDILVFILYLLASALCMQLIAGDRPWFRSVLLGAVLGLAYLAKAVMFPLAFVFFAAVLLQARRSRILPKLMASIVVFALVSVPFCLALSRAKGRFTFGDVGVLAYRHVMGIDEQALPASGDPRLAAAPHIQQYVQTIDLGTYPPWADPSHGYKGGPTHFNLSRQINRTHVVLRYYFDLFAVQLGALIAGMLVLLFWGRARRFIALLGRYVVLWLPALAGLAFYATMRVEGRFLAGYAIALFAACAGSIRIRDAENIGKLSRSVAFAISIVLFSQAAVQVGHEGLKLFGHESHPPCEVAAALGQMGVQEGDWVGYMGDALYDDVWAHLARVKIAVEIPREDVLHFWASAPSERSAAISWAAAMGAKALVARDVPDNAMAMGWRKVGDTDYFILPIRD